MGRAAERGHVLILVVLASLLLAVGMMGQIDHEKAQQTRSQRTSAALLQARQALLAYAVTYLDNAEHSGEVFGYLPCPDRDGDGVADLVCGSAGALAVGLLPYRTLGMPQIVDGYGHCLWYVVSGRFKNNAKSRPMNWDTRSDLTLIAPPAVPSHPDDADGGPAAVIIAPGPALIARASTDRYCHTLPDSSQWAAHIESLDAVNLRLTTGGGSDNDRLVWLTAREIAARLLSRNDYALFVNQGIDRVAAHLSKPGAPAPAGAHRLPQGSGALPPDNSFDRNFYQNWSDHFRYVRCPGASPCYSVNGAPCTGILLFGGLPDPAQNQTDWPRPTSDREDRHYFEADALAVLAGTQYAVISAQSAVPQGAKADDPVWRRDIMRCLN